METRVKLLCVRPVLFKFVISWKKALKTKAFIWRGRRDGGLQLPADFFLQRWLIYACVWRRGAQRVPNRERAALQNCSPLACMLSVAVLLAKKRSSLAVHRSVRI